jgi:hypothetical protein
MTDRHAATEEVAALSELSLDELRSAWRTRYGAPPTLRSRELLSLMLAWRIQARAEGGLDTELRRSLRNQAQPPTSPVPEGVRLVREWQGVKHEVRSLPEGGFLYKDERYKSLSQIARLITGSRWNGPRFFGLRSGGAE